MSFYDTIRCIWHDPRFLVEHHADTILTLAATGSIFMLWAVV